MLKDVLPRIYTKISRRGFIYLILIFVGIIVAVVYVVVDRQFRIKTIIVTEAADGGNKYFLETLYGRSTIYSSEEDLASLIIKTNPLVKTAAVRKRYPATIEVAAVPYRSVALLTVNEGYFALSEESVIVKKVKNSNSLNLPIINYYQKLNYHQDQVGDAIEHSDLIKAMDLASYLPSIGLSVDTVDIGGNDMIVLNSSDKRFIFSTKKSTDAQKYEIKTIITKLKFEGREYVSLDLRFDKPVLKLQ